MSSFPYLTVLVLLPAGAAVLVPVLVSLLAPSSPEIERRIVQVVSWVGTLATLGVAIAVLAKFAGHSGGFQLVTSHTWISSLGIRWTLGVDGISLFLVLMTALLFPIALAAAGPRRDDPTFVAWLLLLEAACLGSFLALDVLVFFLFFELTLVPVYFIVSGFGHERHGYAATKFFLYTLGASAFLLVGILALVAIHASQTGVHDVQRARPCLHAPVRHRRRAPLPRLYGGVRREGADLPVPYLVAGRVPGVAGRRHRHPRRRDGQARHVRDRALRPGAVPEGRRDAGPAPAHPRGDRHHLWRRRGGGAARLETPRRLLVTRPHRLHRGGGFRPHRAPPFPGRYSR